MWELLGHVADRSVLGRSLQMAMGVAEESATDEVVQVLEMRRRKGCREKRLVGVDVRFASRGKLSCNAKHGARAGEGRGHGREGRSGVRACCVNGLYTDVDVERQGIEVSRVPRATSVQGAEGDDDGEVDARWRHAGRAGD